MPLIIYHHMLTWNVAIFTNAIDVHTSMSCELLTKPDSETFFKNTWPFLS